MHALGRGVSVCAATAQTWAAPRMEGTFAGWGLGFEVFSDSAESWDPSQSPQHSLDGTSHGQQEAAGVAVVLGWTWDELSSTRLWAIRAALDDAWKLQATFATGCR